jgi:hypothetical protein
MIQSLLFALAALALAVPAHAGKGGPTLPPTVDPTITKSGRNDNRLYVGINWNFGVRNGATAVVGYRGAKVAAGGHVHGYKAEISYVLSGAPMGFGEARLKYLNGSRSAQGEAGYSFASQAFLVNLGAQGPYINGGVDYLFDKGWLASIGVNTLGRVKKPAETLSCPASYTLNNGVCEFD